MTQKEQIDYAAKLLHITSDDALKYHTIIEEEKLIYVSVPEKGGMSIIVGEDGSVLFADSSIGYSKHLSEYKNGRRTPIEQFGI